MKTVKYFIPILLICSCCTIKESDEQSQKKISDLSASNWMLRSEVENKKLALIVDSLNIAAYKDSLWRCREDSRVVK
jgi:hypothetical protein